MFCAVWDDVFGVKDSTSLGSLFALFWHWFGAFIASFVLRLWVMKISDLDSVKSSHGSSLTICGFNVLIHILSHTDQQEFTNLDLKIHASTRPSLLNDP